MRICDVLFCWNRNAREVPERTRGRLAVFRWPDDARQAASFEYAAGGCDARSADARLEVRERYVRELGALMTKRDSLPAAVVYAALRELEEFRAPSAFEIAQRLAWQRSLQIQTGHLAR